MMKNTNRLIHSTSPYLLQHAHNPVDWFEWGDEALARAKNEDKPILISIGYSSCHWCHVMERESFEKDSIAKVMNDLFVCIKVDREERPDIDQIYMEAVQALGVNGGWPLNVFLTPDQKPFFGGTYFSPQAWVHILQNVSHAYQVNRTQIEETAEELRLHLLRSDVARFKQKPADTTWAADIESIYKKLETGFDEKWGGLDKAPKFIMPSVWQLLLRYYHLTNDGEALAHITFTLDKIEQGGIYDQVGGGFARYSVDGQWFAPHFEKMLYDNAQLISLYSEAYKITGNEHYKTVVRETVDWLEREMTDGDGGFYSALDADSEGVEGKFYVWTQQEFSEVVGEHERVLSEYFSVQSDGNWEHGNNILIRYFTDGDFLREHQLTPDRWRMILTDAKAKLLARRSQRIRPGLDDKIITSWNAMTICGLADAYMAFGDERYLKLAQRNMNFIQQHLLEGSQLFRSYKGKKSQTKAFLDDYAYVIQALIKLYQVTFKEVWIEQAADLANFSVKNFFDVEEGFFFYSSETSEKLISRKKEIFDNVIPSSNAIMAQNLFQLGTLLENESWLSPAREMVGSLSNLIVAEPNYMSQWGIASLEIRKGLKEVLMTGNGIQSLREELQREFFPFIIVQGTASKSQLPLFEGKVPIDGRDTIYVCYERTCQLPVHSLTKAKEQIRQS